MDFHPHLHALVADGLFARSGVFHVMPETGLKPLEELFRARVIRFLVDKGLLPPERARMLRGWVHSGFNVHRGRRVLSRERKDMERLIRNPFSVEKMWATEPGPASASGSILYRCGMNKKIGRNFEIFTPWDFIAAITQHIADKSFQLVRYYGWYSNKIRGRRAKQGDEEVQTEGDAVEVIDVSAHEPRRIPSKKWRELIKKVWEADPLRCLKCSREMRIVSLIDQEDVSSASCAISGSGKRGSACIPAPTRRAKRPSIRGSTTPSPTTTPNRSWRSPPPETSGSARVRLSHPLFSGAQPSGGSRV